MIYSVWIINKDGLPLLHRNYSQFKMDPALFSGFVTAIYNFTLEMGGGKLKEIGMGNSKLVLYTLPGGGFVVIVISATDKSERYISFFDRLEKELLSRIELSQHPKETGKQELANRILDNLVEDYNARLIPQDLSKITILKDPKVQTLLTQLFLSKGTGELLPELDSQSRFGCRYPLAESLLDTNTEKVILILNHLADVGILLQNEYETVLACPVCGSVDMHVAYQCPKCGSTQIRKTRLIKHYKCNFEAPAEMFVKSGGLECPNCHIPLKSKGRDYSVVEGFYCTKCQHTSAVFDEIYHCFKCKQKMKKTQADTMTIFYYTLNPDIRADLETFLATTMVPAATHTWAVDYPIKLPEVKDPESQAIVKEIENARNQIREIEEKWKRGEITTAERDHQYIKLRSRIRELMDKLKVLTKK
ncbi:MAG: hypothetical protein ACP6IU_01380 [Candidatus Asgardarchaeia archaeon]